MPQLGVIETRAKELRAAIDMLYAGLPVEKKPWINLVPPTPDKEISDLIRRYIPVGISFDDAEAILQRADFEIIQPRKTALSPTYTNHLSTYDVVAQLRRFTENPPAHMLVRVVLRPKGVMDYGMVGELWGRISKKEDR